MIGMIMALSAALGIVDGILEGWLEKNDIKKDLTVLQKACLLGTAKTLRYVLDTSGAVSQKSRNFTGYFRVSQFPL